MRNFVFPQSIRAVIAKPRPVSGNLPEINRLPRESALKIYGTAHVPYIFRICLYLCEAASRIMNWLTGCWEANGKSTYVTRENY